jgi:DNA mismatch repair protein MutS
MAAQKQTPLMQQYFKIKSQYSDSLLMFQVGDFYELFFDDAKRASSFLAIALTKRGKNNGEDIPLCGIPIHALNHYLVKLIKGGFRVAICDQLTKPQPGKVVERGVTQVFTPGTLTDSAMLDEKSASYLLSFFPRKESWGLVFSELLTAQLFATSVPAGAYKMVEAELIRFFPDEVILPAFKSLKSFNTYFKQLGYSVSEEKEAENDGAKLWLEKQFDSKILQVLEQQVSINETLKSLYSYLKKNQEKSLNQFKTIQFYQPDDYLALDFATQKNLEIVKNNQDGGRKNTLLFVLDKAKTPMGSRTIKKWLLRPLIQEEKILQRQEVVGALCKQINTMQQIEEYLGGISDLERIIGRIALRRATQQDYLALKDSLNILPSLKLVLQDNLDFYLTNLIQEKMLNFSSLVQLLECSLNDDFSFNWIIKTGFDQELDRLRNLVENGQQEILKLEQKEIVRTKINSLKIRYNQVTGYYIEVTNPNLHLVPDDYIEQQKLVNRKRFVTQELKDLERELFKAQNEIEIVEGKVFDRVKNDVALHLSSLRQLAQALAYLDALFGFARVAYENNYVAPTFNLNRDINIVDGRHPVVEQKLDSNFVSNDTKLTDSQALWIITGPNMGGKSTYLRQVALTCIMAQCGSFIPAKSASLPILDRIFTRIGSGDNLVEGKSTFLVEMEETATICTQATKNSLVILDEVGRGTSTFDGIALAQAIIEYVFCSVGARCLFATHYHELTKLEQKFIGIKNYHMLSRKTNNRVIFLHKIAPGVSGGSFGIEVAKLAQLPEKVVSRASQILKSMEKNGVGSKQYYAPQGQKDLFGAFASNKDEQELNLLQERVSNLEQELTLKNKIIQKLSSIKLDEMTPKQAFDLLWEIRSDQT